MLPYKYQVVFDCFPSKREIAVHPNATWYTSLYGGGCVGARVFVCVCVCVFVFVCGGGGGGSKQTLLRHTKLKTLLMVHYHGFHILLQLSWKKLLF